jgi:glycine/D-amino acid oxidase-like deaminating enzyme
MNIVIIGTGFAGLATSWFLIELGCRVTFYDAKGIGQGASGRAAGLLHPYVGEQTRCNLWGDEAVAAAKELFLHIEPSAILQEGLIRIAQTDEQREALRSYKDVEPLGKDRFYIKSGVVIDTALYLRRLFARCIERGAVFEQRRITTLEELRDFDHRVIAAGHELDHLLPQFATHFSKVKGQILQIHLPESTETVVAKGYIVKSSQKGVYLWGSTYERDYASEEPDQDAALSLLPRKDFPLPESLDILHCHAGVRLARRKHYVPFVDQIDKGIWCFGGLGSRGLLYHAFLGKKLAEAIVTGNKHLIPKECRT